MKLLFAFLMIATFSGGTARAEYRAFLLKITSADGAQSRQIASTLDPDQYRGYYPLHEGETIVYIDTWRCRGNTSFQDICPSPHPPPAEDPASAPEK